MLDQHLRDQIIAICQNHMAARHYKVFLFGSRASGKAFPDSDYDIGIEADRPLTSSEHVEIQYDLEEKIRALQTFDFVDFSTVSDDFRKIASKEIEVLYEQ